MASTYSPQDALNLVQAFGHGVPIDAVRANACDMINSMIWTFYPWGWSIANLTPITLSDAVQDYTATDTNILRPLKMRLCRTDITPNEWRELKLLGNLAPELSRKGGIDVVTACGYFSSSNFFRLDIAAQVGSGQTIQLQGEYQKVPTKITENNLTTAFAFPDTYYNCFVEGLKWKIYQLSDDARAGGISVSKNGGMTKVYTGQFGIFFEQLQQMARTEDLSAGDEFMYPENPFGVARSYWPGIFGQ